MDLDLQIDELLLPPYAGESRLHETEINDGENSYRVVFRLPNGEDQEEAAACARESVDSATELVLRRCVASVTSGHGAKMDDVPPAVLRGLPEKMAALDPQAEVMLDLACPECGNGFVTPFDISSCMCQELSADEREFYREIHALSFHYHWNEQAVLGLSRRKRRIYLELLADELASGGRKS
jgi:hypothetical protein